MLIEHPDVREVVVVGLDDAEWGQAIVAVIVPESGTAPAPEQLREFARSKLRGSRTPDRIVFRDELPTTPTGKVLRREILEDPAGGSRALNPSPRQQQGVRHDQERHAHAEPGV